MSDLAKIIGRGEDSKTQFKVQFDSIDSLAVEVSAMANTEGGLVVVGVDDLHRLNQWISNACSQKTEPPLNVITENVNYKNKLKIPYRGIGSGVLRMIQECRDAKISGPEFIEDRNAELFKVIFSRN